MAAGADEGAADAAGQHERIAGVGVVGRGAAEAEAEDGEEDHGEEHDEDQQRLRVERDAGRRRRRHDGEHGLAEDEAEGREGGQQEPGHGARQGQVQTCGLGAGGVGRDAQGARAQREEGELVREEIRRQERVGREVEDAEEELRQSRHERELGRFHAGREHERRFRRRRPESRVDAFARGARHQRDGGRCWTRHYEPGEDREDPAREGGRLEPVVAPLRVLLGCVRAPSALLEVCLGQQGRIGRRRIWDAEERADGVAEGGEGIEGRSGEDDGHGDDQYDV